MSQKDKWNRREVLPTGKANCPKYDRDRAINHGIAYACVEGIKSILKGAGKAVEFGVTEIVNNDGSKTRTKKR